MNYNTVKDLLIADARGRGYDNFTAAEVENASVQALRDLLGVEEERDMRRLSPQDFAIIEQVLEETTPAMVEDIIGQFAEVQTFGRNEQVVFSIKNVGAKRIMQAIVPGARAGIYKARRLDNKQLQVTTEVQTIGYALSLEDLLTGRVTIKDYVDIVSRGFVESVYQRMIKALRTAAATAPAANRVETATSAIDELAPALDKVLRVVAAYGTPTIFAFESVASEISNFLGGAFPANAYVTADGQEIREYGHVTKYKGRNVVVLPNFLTDNSNSAWVFSEDEMFILPANEKPIKVAFHGNLHIQEVAIPSGGVEFHAHREIGVAVISNNALGSIKVKDNTAGGAW